MDRAGYVAALKGKIAAASRPVLTDAEVDVILDAYPTPDADGRAPSDEGWTAAYDLNAAAAEGWRQKAGRVAGDFNFSADEASYSKADVLAHCLDMEATYAALSHGTMNTGAGASMSWIDRQDAWDGSLIP